MHVAIVAAAAAAALSLSTTPGAAAATGFGPLSGPGGCVLSPGATGGEDSAGCTPGAGLLGPNAVAASADGANVYVAGGTAGNNVASSFGDVVIFKRDPATGAIAESGCLSSDGTDGRDGASGACTPTPSLLGADGVAVGADGLTVYVTSRSSASVVAFARDPATGSLARLGCLQGTPRPGSPCRPAELFPGSGPVVAGAGGNALYVAAPVEGAISTLLGSPAVASLFSTPPVPSFLYDPCVAVNGLDGPCAVGTAMQGVDALALSPGAKNLYAAAPASAAIDVFTLDATGALTETGCLKASAPPGLCGASAQIDGPTELALSPDGRDVYAGDTAESGGRIDVLARNESTGALTDASCVDFLPAPRKPEPEEGAEEKEERENEPPLPPDRCKRVPGLESRSVLAASGDGSAVYAFGSETAVIFSRDPASGRLTETSCAGSGDDRCTSLPKLSGVEAAAVSPDGHEVYVTAGDRVMVFGIGAAVVSARASTTRAGEARLRVACPAALRHRCSGRVELTRAILGARHGRHRARARRIAVGYSNRYAIRPGHEAVVRMRLSRTGLRALLARRHVRLMAVVRADALAGGSGYGRHVVLMLAR